MEEFLNREYLGNTALSYLTALGILLAAIIVIGIFRKIFVKRLKDWAERTETTVDDFIVRGVEKAVVPLLYFGALVFAIRTITLHPGVEKALHYITVIIVTFFIIRLITSTINFSLNAYMSRQERGEEKQRQMRGVLTIISVIVWAVGLVFLLDNFGFNVSAVVAGLGIGGIAIALAAQTILGDLFSYFVIFFDRPFEVGDFIIVGDKRGTVEYVGIKTTRIRSLDGEQLVFSNTDLTNSRVHNYKRMERRRVVFKLGLIYQTPSSKLKEAANLVKQIIEDQPDATFDRGHFASYGDFSLNFEFVYFVEGSDYVKYMNIQQAINLKIYEEFEKREMEFAYPTQTIFMSKENSSNGETQKIER